MQPNLDQVIEILKKEGLSDDQVSMFIQNLTQAFAQHLYLIIAEQLSEQDMIELNKIEDNSEREKQMSMIFEKKNNQKLKNLSDGFVKNYTDKFLEGYNLKSVTV